MNNEVVKLMCLLNYACNALQAIWSMLCWLLLSVKVSGPSIASTLIEKKCIMDKQFHILVVYSRKANYAPLSSARRKDKKNRLQLHNVRNTFA